MWLQNCVIERMIYVPTLTGTLYTDVDMTGKARSTVAQYLAWRATSTGDETELSRYSWWELAAEIFYSCLFTPNAASPSLNQIRCRFVCLFFYARHYYLLNGFIAHNEDSRDAICWNCTSRCCSNCMQNTQLEEIYRAWKHKRQRYVGDEDAVQSNHGKQHSLLCIQFSDRQIRHVFQVITIRILIINLELQSVTVLCHKFSKASIDIRLRPGIASPPEEDRATATGDLQYFVTIGSAVPEIYSRTDRHTDRHTDKLIAILRSLPGRSKNYTYNTHATSTVSNRLLRK